MARKAVSRKRKAPASPRTGSDAQGPQVRAERVGTRVGRPRHPEGDRVCRLGNRYRDPRSVVRDGLGGVEPRPVGSGLGHQEFTGEHGGRGEELKGNLKMVHILRKVCSRG